MICAYKESPYLEDCIRSLKSQSIGVGIKIATSTPNDLISGLSGKYDIPVYVNHGPSGIAGDWTFALSVAGTPIALIAHQDDIYESTYAEEVLKAANKAKDPIIIFTDYGELRDGARVTSNRLLRIKKFLLFPLRVRAFHTSRWVRRRVLSTGSPICCPSVSYVLDKVPAGLFDPSYQVSLDWAAWEKLSKLKGSFVYIHKTLMFHRIHGESETTKQIENSGRSQEDLLMYRKFWPAPIASILEHFYRKAELSNKI